jgi:hypothetical protein
VRSIEPVSAEVRQWLGGARRFLVGVVPDGRFVFHAGWNEHWNPSRSLELTHEEFLAKIEAER